MLNGKPYYYIGTNYWYGGLLGLVKNENKGIERLHKELDFLRSKGVVNLRVMAGVEGAGEIQGEQRVKPALQTAKGIFNEQQLKGLDILLSEMGKRNMKAVIFLSNNWDWSGGFLQYLNWNGMLPDSLLQKKLDWNELRDEVSKFYSCETCVQDYLQQAATIIERTNSVTGKKYKDDDAIMSWELANEPRPMRPVATVAYLKWIQTAAAFIKSKDKNHLVTTGSEGSMGTESLGLFQQSHQFKNVDYLTIHIWPKNWGWFSPETMRADLPRVIANTETYIQQHDSVAQLLGKPLVIEEFGLPRDGHSFSVTTATSLRDMYYQHILSAWQKSVQQNGVIGGVNFWAFGGGSRPIANQTFWKEGDEYMGDPPMEEQGLNSVFDSDASTWNIIAAAALQTGLGLQKEVIPATAGLPADKMATKETVALYRNLKKLLPKGIMFGHQDDLAYGVNWKYVAGRSDVKETAGDYPAVYGWEMGNIEYKDSLHNLDSVPFDRMKTYIKEAYQRGGVITLSWHADNPLNGESAWDTTHAVQSILPGGAKHEMYKTWLDHFAAFVKELKGAKGEAIPILFRPYHELTGNWFWWCKNTCTPAEFTTLWRFTIGYLQNDKKLHNLLYIYNTADFKTKEEFLERYPGDDMADLVSFDNYQGGPGSDSSFIKEVQRKMTIVDEVAVEQNKIPTLAEAGYEAIPNANWWTQTLLPALAGHSVSYVLVWRNHGYQQSTQKMHYYAPYKGHPSEADFKVFYNKENVLFEKDIEKEKMYQW